MRRAYLLAIRVIFSKDGEILDVHFPQETSQLVLISVVAENIYEIYTRKKQLWSDDDFQKLQSNVLNSTCDKFTLLLLEYENY